MFDKHVYECEFLNDELKDEENPFEVIFDDNIEEQMKVGNKFYGHIQNRTKLRSCEEIRY